MVRKKDGSSRPFLQKSYKMYDFSRKFLLFDENFLENFLV